MNVPPHNVEMEQAVIASMMVELAAAKLVLTRVDPVWFYTEKHRIIMQVLGIYVEQNIEPDMVLACQWLTKAGVLGEVGGQAYLTAMMDQCTTAGHVESYINELKKLYLDRQIVAAVASVNADCTPANIEALRMRSQDRDCADAGGVINVADCGEKILEMTGPLKHGLYDLFEMPEMDELFNGTCPGDILTIGARPGVGKTVMATHIALSFARRYKEPVLYFSTEMRHEETLARILSPMSRVPGWKFRKRYFDKEGKDREAIFNAASELTKLPFHMVDKCNPTLADIRAGTIKTKCRLLIVDYLQHMNLEVGKEGTPAALERMMQGLKSNGRDMGVITIILSQIDRDVDKLTVRQSPQMSDLKGSGSIEQESDAIILLHKHNKKDKDSGIVLVPNIPNVKAIEAIHAKNRHGKADVSVQMIFDEKFIEFREWNSEEAVRWNDKIVKKTGEQPQPEKKHAKLKKWGTDSLAGGGTEDPEEQQQL